MIQTPILKTYKQESDMLKNAAKNEFLLLISLLIGYVIICALPSVFRVESRSITVPYRILVFFFSVYILSKNTYHRKFDLNSSLAFLFFWLFYFIKTIYSFHTDFYLPEFEEKQYEVYLRIFTINLIPCLAILSLDYKKIDYAQLIKSIFWLLFMMLSINLLYTVFYLNQFNLNSGIFSVYYISAGHYGASLVILSLYLLLFRTDSALTINKKVILLAILIGLFAVYTSAARSPVLAIMIVGLYFILIKKKIKFLYLFFFLMVLTVITFYVSRQILHIESAFIERNYAWIFEGNTSGREYFFVKSISIFKENIIFGGRVLYEDGMYPHNIFLELLMAGGILLLILFGLVFYPILKKINYFLNVSKSNFYILPLFCLWIQYCILSLTSNNIHTNPEFWYFSSLIITISINTYNEKT